MSRYVGNIGDGTYREEYQKILAKSQVDKDVSSMKWLLQNELGRWFLLRMFQACKLNGSTFTGNSGTFYNEGRREVAVAFYNLIRNELGVEGVKLLHQAEIEMFEFEKSCKDSAEKLMEDEYDE